MLSAVLNLPRVKLYSQWDRPLEPGEVQLYREMLLKRVQGWPLAYLTGKKAFLSWDFTVTPAVLIPRPETELLVEFIVDRFKNKPPVRGVDVGTGSGAIVIALAKLLPESKWEATDISAAALKIAAQNAEDLGVAGQVNFREGDLLEPVKTFLPYDVIVSNPPYIPSAEIDTLQPEVRKEPHSALDGGPDGLDCYRRLFTQTLPLLKETGILAVEHGYDQRQSLLDLAAKNGLACETLTDLAGLDRILVAYQPGTPNA